MIRTVSAGDGAHALEWELEPGATAFVDRDWVPGEAASDVPALIIAADGTAHLNGTEVTIAEGSDPAQSAAGALSGAVQAAASTLGSPRRVSVPGHGFLADAFRRLLAAPGEPGEGRPDAVVETTGDPGRIVAALEEVADGGRVLLAGPPAGRTVDANLYKDLHRRGLRVRGFALEHHTDAGTGVTAGWQQPGAARRGQPLPESPWYRLDG